jgi:hypothetical protein
VAKLTRNPSSLTSRAPVLAKHLDLLLVVVENKYGPAASCGYEDFVPSHFPPKECLVDDSMIKGGCRIRYVADFSPQQPRKEASLNAYAVVS